MCGDVKIEARRLKYSALEANRRSFNEAESIFAAEGSYPMHHLVTLELLQHIAWQEQELERLEAVRVAAKMVQDHDAYCCSSVCDVDGCAYDALDSAIAAIDAYRAAKAAAHGPTEPPTDLQGG